MGLANEQIQFFTLPLLPFALSFIAFRVLYDFCLNSFCDLFQSFVVLRLAGWLHCCIHMCAAYVFVFLPQMEMRAMLRMMDLGVSDHAFELLFASVDIDSSECLRLGVDDDDDDDDDADGFVAGA